MIARNLRKVKSYRRKKRKFSGIGVIFYKRKNEAENFVIFRTARKAIVEIRCFFLYDESEFYRV